jgi:uncharacterized protein YndB with AHSA1/START domain
MTHNNPAAASDVEFVLSRTFNAPRTLVWDAWSKPEHLKQWWGPEGWELPVCEIDFREGGTWVYCMKGPDGMESWGKAYYQELKRPERIVYRDTFIDADRQPLEGMPEMTITVEFAEADGKTTLTSRALFPSAEALKATVEMGMEEGMKQTWDRLEALLASMQK